jgi:hypothetical protein
VGHQEARRPARDIVPCPGLKGRSLAAVAGRRDVAPRSGVESALDHPGGDCDRKHGADGGAIPQRDDRAQAIGCGAGGDGDGDGDAGNGRNEDQEAVAGTAEGQAPISYLNDLLAEKYSGHARGGTCAQKRERFESGGWLGGCEQRG